MTCNNNLIHSCPPYPFIPYNIRFLKDCDTDEEDELYIEVKDTQRLRIHRNNIVSLLPQFVPPTRGVQRFAGAP